MICSTVARPGVLTLPLPPADAAAPGGFRANGPAAAVLQALFGEAPGGFVLSAPPEALRTLAERARALAGGALELSPIGVVGGDALTIGVAGESLTTTLAELSDAHRSLEGLF